MVPPQMQKEVSMEFGEQEEEKKGGPVRSENGSKGSGSSKSRGSSSQNSNKA